MNRDDDFFKLPKARNPLRRIVPEADTPSSPPPEPPASPARVPPIVSSDPKPAVSPTPHPEPSPVPARVEASGAASAPVAAVPASGKPLEPPAARNPLRRDPSPEERASAPPPARPKTPNTPRSEPPGTPPPSAPSRRLWLWPLLGVGVIGLVIVGGLLGYWAFMNVAARMVLANQPLTIRLPEEADITLRTDYKIDVLMKGVINAQVPLVQTLDLPVDGTYDTIIDLDTKVPLETVITYEGVIPVDSMADIEAKAPVNFQNVKKYKNLHFKAKLPLKLNLPVKLVVPVKQVIDLKYKGPLRVAIKHVIKAPVGTTLNTALNVNQQFSVPVTSSLPLRATLPQHPVKATIVDADLFLNLETLRLEKKPAETQASDGTR